MAQRQKLKPCPFCGHAENHPRSITDRTPDMKDNTDWTLATIIEQLKSCHYTCEAGSLEMNAAFKALEGMVEQMGQDMSNDRGKTREINLLTQESKHRADVLEECRNHAQRIMDYNKDSRTVEWLAAWEIKQAIENALSRETVTAGIHAVLESESLRALLARTYRDAQEMQFGYVITDQLWQEIGRALYGEGGD